MPRGDLHAVAVELQRAALAAVEPSATVRRHIRREGDALAIANHRYDLCDYARVFVVGGGKAAVPMAAAISDMLSDRLTKGVIVTKYGHAISQSPIPALRILIFLSWC